MAEPEMSREEMKAALSRLDPAEVAAAIERAPWPAGFPLADPTPPPMTSDCRNCGKPIIPCESIPAHFGCSSACGFLHVDPRAHACEPRSDGPYAQPSSSVSGSAT